MQCIGDFLMHNNIGKRKDNALFECKRNTNYDHIILNIAKLSTLLNPNLEDAAALGGNISKRTLRKILLKKAYI